MTRHGLSKLVVVVSVLLGVLCISGYWIARSAHADEETYSGVTFTTAITGSDNDGFDVYATNAGADAKKCTVKVTVTLGDDSTKTYEYSGTARVTGEGHKMWFGGEAGLKPAPIKEVEITSGSCD